MPVFLRISHLYPQVLENFKKNNKEIHKKNYKETLNLLHLERYSVSNFYSQELKKFNYKCHDIVSNAEFLQSKWIKEKKVNIAGFYNTLYEQAKYYKPNVIFIGNADLCQRQFIESLRKLKSVEKILAYHCAPFTIKILNNLSNVDGIVTCTQGYLKKIQLLENQNKLYLPHAFFKITNNIKKIQDRKIDITFIGSIFLDNKLHDNRIDLIYKIILNFTKNSFVSINFSNYFIIKFIWYFFKSLFSLKFFKYFYKIMYIYFKAKRPIFGKSMYKVYENSKIVINKHIEDSNYAGNMRIFEATGCGSLLITDYKNGLDSFFNLKKEIITYKSNEDLIKKCKFYLKNYQRLQNISYNGYKKTINKHNYYLRARELHLFIRSLYS